MNLNLVTKATFETPIKNQHPLINTSAIATHFQTVGTQFRTVNTALNNAGQSITNLNQNLQGLQNTVTSLNENLKAVQNTVKAVEDTVTANYQNLTNRITALDADLNLELQARDRTINAQATEINNLKQRQLESNAKTTHLEAQSIEDKTKIALLEKKVQNLEGAAANETQNKIAQLETTIQLQSKVIDEEKKLVVDLTMKIQQASKDFEAFKEMSNARLEELATKNAQFGVMMAEQQANIVLMRKLAADMVQEEQPPKQEPERKQELKARGLARANSAKLLSNNSNKQ